VSPESVFERGDCFTSEPSWHEGSTGAHSGNSQGKILTLFMEKNLILGGGLSLTVKKMFTYVHRSVIIKQTGFDCDVFLH
jgi:hypothetical protein